MALYLLQEEAWGMSEGWGGKPALIYQVTYYDESGSVVKQVKFDAANLREAIGLVATVPSLVMPEGTVAVDIAVEEGDVQVGTAQS